MTVVRLAALACVALLLAPWTGAARPVPDTVLIVTHTTGYRHASIEPAALAIEQLARDAGMQVETTADPQRFDRPLDTVRTIALVSTTTRRNRPETEWLTGSRRKAFRQFVRRGGGVLAIHGAADSHYAWGWYGRMIGARFARHPKGTPTGTVRHAPVPHPSLAGLPERFAHADEWYWFADVDPALRPLLTLSPASIGETGPGPTTTCCSSAKSPSASAGSARSGIIASSLCHRPAASNCKASLAHRTK